MEKLAQRLVRGELMYRKRLVVLEFSRSIQSNSRSLRWGCRKYSYTGKPRNSGRIYDRQFELGTD